MEASPDFLKREELESGSQASLLFSPDQPATFQSTDYSLGWSGGVKGGQSNLSSIVSLVRNSPFQPFSCSGFHDFSRRCSVRRQTAWFQAIIIVQLPQSDRTSSILPLADIATNSSQSYQARCIYPRLLIARRLYPRINIVCQTFTASSPSRLTTTGRALGTSGQCHFDQEAALLHRSVRHAKRRS